MKPWTDVARPHDDIEHGELELGAFAADLGSVASGDKSVRDVYADPVSFFRATYLTSSMRSLLSDVLGALAGRGGDRVLQLRTPFGGGKTHSLLALYHLCRSRTRLAAFDELRDLPDPGPCRIAVISGVDLDPSVPRVHGNTTAHTLWGEIAWQLAGDEGYAVVERQDTHRQAPGKDELARLFPEDQPTLILLDEALVYVEKAKALSVGESTLGSQVLVFLQTLTELVSKHSRSAMVYSLQRSVAEASGDESLLVALEHLVGRVDAKREPVSGDEVMRVVQKRLFSDLGPEDDRNEVAAGYAELHRRYRVMLAETEDERRNAESEAERFASRVLASYPFHPALLDLMHQRWTTIPSYQRTRGALQFLATVVRALWHSREEQPALIGPGDVHLDDEQVRGAFFSQVGDREGFMGVLNRDLIGPNAGVREVDRRLGAESRKIANLKVGTRVASAVMLYSFGGRTDEEKGVVESELVASLLGPNLDRNVLTTAIADLRDELLFLHSTGRRFRFDKTPNLNQLLASEAAKFDSPEVIVHVRKALEKAIGPSDSVLLWPKDGASIPDNEPVFRVVYLDPEWCGLAADDRDRKLREMFERRGSGATRAYRNALAFALPDRESFEHARSATRRSLAGSSLIRQAKSLNIEGEQLAELKDRAAAAERELTATLERAYVIVLLPMASDDLERPYKFEEIDLSARLSLSRIVHDRVLEGLANNVFDRMTAAKLATLLNLGDSDERRSFVFCTNAVDAAFSYLQFPKLRNASVLRDAIARGVGESAFGYAAMADVDGETLHVEPNRVWIGKATTPDEIDLGSGAVLIAPQYARALLKEAAPPVEAEAPVAYEPPSPPKPEKRPGANLEGGRCLTVGFTVDKRGVFAALQMLPTLADASEKLELSVSIKAEARDHFEKTWVRNVVQEPLDEASVTDQIIEFDD
jgi:hypothetical protein